MKSTAFLCRKLFQLSPSPPSAADVDAGESAFQSLNGPASFNPTTPFDSSMALTILVLLTALFFMGFFSVYVRRFSAAAAAALEDPPSPPSRPGHKRGGGLDPSAVGLLPLTVYENGAARQQYPMIDDCPICLGEYRRGETVKLIPYCGHMFHPGCLDTWLASHVTCPLCRSAQLFKEVCLDVKPDRSIEGSTVDDADRWSGGVRRAASFTHLPNPTVVLQRSRSF